jgi:hypothetical protein
MRLDRNVAVADAVGLAFRALGRRMEVWEPDKPACSRECMSPTVTSE